MDLNTYKLPLQIAAALSSGRPEVLLLGPVKLDEPREVLRLLFDLIADREKQRLKLLLMGQVVEELSRTLRGQADKAVRTLDAFNGCDTRDEMAAALSRKEEV